MTKVTLSIALATWRAFRMGCIARGTSASREVERFMLAQLETWQHDNTTAS